LVAADAEKAVLRTSAAESTIFASVNILATLVEHFCSAGGQLDDALPFLRRRLDYIAANSITPSRGAADCGDYREVAAVATCARQQQNRIAFGHNVPLATHKKERDPALAAGPLKDCCVDR
jgi:hypothetical protein